MEVGTNFIPAAEKGPQLRSRFAKILNVPRRYASGFDSPAALLDGLFEQPVWTHAVLLAFPAEVLRAVGFSGHSDPFSLRCLTLS